MNLPVSASISYPSDANEAFYSIEEGSFWFRHRNDCILEMVRRFPPGGEILDVGGGNGFVALHLQKHGFPVTLLEPGRGAARARERGVRNVIQTDLDGAGLQDASVAAAGVFDVVEHIADDRAFLGKLHRLLCPGGRLYLTVPAFPRLWSAEDEAAGHYRRYGRAELERVLFASGFRPEFLTGLFFWLPPAILIFRALPRLLPGRAPGRFSGKIQAQDHRMPGFLEPFSRFLNRWERGRICRGDPLSFGSSWMAVATRI